LTQDKNWWRSEEGKAWCKLAATHKKTLVESLQEDGLDIVGSRLFPPEKTITVYYNSLGDLEHIPAEYEGIPILAEEWRPEERKLITNLRDNLPQLEKLLEKYSSHWSYEDHIYRFYHHSFKVYYLQGATEEIVTALRGLAPWKEKDEEFDPMFMEIVSQGTGKNFEMDHNKEWTKHTRPIIEAFFHAKYFLEMAVRYGKVISKPQRMLDSGWAAVLCLYRMR